jgi:Mg-chelatase subunit ChlD
VAAIADEKRHPPSIPWADRIARWQERHHKHLAGPLDQNLTSHNTEQRAESAATLLAWFDELNETDSTCALAVFDRMESLLSKVGIEGLGRWILTGLRMYPGERESRRAYFRLEDRRAVEALHGEASAKSLWQSIPSLALVMHGLLGREIGLQSRRQSVLEAMPLRPILTPSHLLLPDDYTALDGPDRYRLYRAATAHAVAHLRYSTASMPALTLKPMSIAVVSALEDARVELLLVREYPGVKRWFLEFLRRSVKPTSLGFSALLGRMNLAIMDPSYADDNFWVNKARRGFETLAENLLDYAAFRSFASILANDLGQMRVPFPGQRYVVPEPYRDDNSFLWDFGESSVAPADSLELQIKAPQVEDLAFDDGQTETTSAEIELGRDMYPEWDSQVLQMRSQWFTVIDKKPSLQVRTKVAKWDTSDMLLAPLKRSRRLSRRQRLRRQWEGDDIDLNAAVEAVIDQRLQLSPDLRLFLRAGYEELTSSILVLLDLSESTNDYPDGSKYSILDVEKRAAILLAQSVMRSNDRIAVHGFSSNTRAEVNYYHLLEFGAPLDETALTMIQSVSGRYSTRMGAALRRATACLAHEPFEHRAIVLVTDGAPADVDVFKSGYLIEDARSAVHEARLAGVKTFCIALDRQADPYVRRIFGWNNYRIVDDPVTLPAQLSGLYGRLATL